MASDTSELGRRLRAGDRSAAPAALNVIENRADRDAAAALLGEVSPAELGGEAPAHLVGVTGPPGAGKSTLLSALVAEWRERGRTVAVLAVDPSWARDERVRLVGAMVHFARHTASPDAWASMSRAFVGTVARLSRAWDGWTPSELDLDPSPQAAPPPRPCLLAARLLPPRAVAAARRR